MSEKEMQMQKPEISQKGMLCPADEALQDLVNKVLPGKSKAIRHLREQIRTFCGNPASRALLLRGPVGSGKSTLARLVAFGKRIAPLRVEEARELMARIRWEAPGLIDLKSEMTFYVELTVTGLVETLASSQLFGHVKGAFTGADRDKEGVFEMAATGRAGDPESGAGVTGGVVFLDEIADIPLQLQAKLLPVLSGGQFYRVGGEGRGKYAMTYNGIVIGASWQDLDQSRMRADLLSRISANVIEIPSIAERPEDLPILVAEIQNHVIERLKERIGEFYITDPKVDRGFWERLEDRLVLMTSETVDKLSRIDWSRHGELRGLTQVVERVVIGAENVDFVMENLASSESREYERYDIMDVYIKELLNRNPDDGGLASHVKVVERQHRAALKDLIYANRSVSYALANALNIDEATLRKQAGELTRERRRASSRKGKR